MYFKANAKGYHGKTESALYFLMVSLCNQETMTINIQWKSEKLKKDKVWLLIDKVVHKVCSHSAYYNNFLVAAIDNFYEFS